MSGGAALLARMAAMAVTAAAPAAAAAQVSTPSPPSADPAVTPVPEAAAAPVQPQTAGSKHSYLPADFARFAPRTAYDMLVQIPGFTIATADQERGLGQASENVLVNGQRIANKSGGAVTELQNVAAADVERIEIVDAATLGVAGLAGQVANVVIKTTRVGGGRFEWQPYARAHFAEPAVFRGSISYAGKSGPVDYTVSVDNPGGRGAFGGPVFITDRTGAPIEHRDELYHGESELATLRTKFGLDGPGSSTGNLTLSITPYRAPSYYRERRTRTDGANRTRTTETELDGTYYDINADYDFRLGPGRLKLIGLRHVDHEPVVTTQLTRFDSGAAPNGIRLGRDSLIEETIARAEYTWKAGRNAWQFSLERALNALDQRGSLETLNTTGAFLSQPFPDGSGKVQELRYEGTATLSRPLGKRIDLQAVLGAEASTLARIDGDVSRRFFRPKGSVSLGWRPAAGWEASLKLRRRVGQISFYDFLSQPNLQQERQNSGNPELVPPQSWEIEGQVTRELGAWGRSRLRFYAHRVEDIVDIVPIGTDGEGVGNLPSASRFGAESVSTWQFDPLGWKGAKLDATFGFERTRVRDPLTGEGRPITGAYDAWAKLALRRDVPNSQIAWGVSGSFDHYAPYVYLTEYNRSWEGPVLESTYIEHKDVFGLTVRLQVANLLNARHRQDRYVFEGRRDTSALAYRQQANQLIGPIFSLTVRGSF